MAKDKLTEEMITEIMKNFKDVIITGMVECPECFPYTIATINFTYYLKTKNIDIKFNQIFDGDIYQEIFRECEKYLYEQ